MTKPFSAVLGAALVLLAFGGTVPQAQTPRTSAPTPGQPSLPQPALGRIDFPTSGKADAQPDFIRGMLLLHSFEFDDAREAFVRARTIDPSFAMAYWGEALSHTYPLWRHRDRDAGLEALNALAPTPAARQAKAPTPREQAYLRAIEPLYTEADDVAALRAFEEALGRVAQEFPDDDEAASLHAVYILATNIEHRDFAVDMRAAAIVEDVFMRNPEHPGVLHYMIHAYDNPMHAPLGLRAARRYARIASGAAHALHMTSHIFLALGMWDETVASNEQSWAASAARVSAKSLPVDAHGYHAYHWLAYAYLQQGRHADARQVVDRTLELAKQSSAPRTAFHYLLARAAYIVDTQRWDRLPPSFEPKSVAPVARAAELSAEGLAAVRTGRLDAAEALLPRLQQIAATASSSDSHHGCAAGSISAADRTAIDVMHQQLVALLRYAQGRKEEGLALLTKAAEAEDAMPYEFGPPQPVKPSHELLGEMLLDLGRPSEAQKAFAASLGRAPGRALSLVGLMRAATQNRDEAAAADARATLKANWHRADADVQRLGTM
jgi:tetratricopeptide (TPR) repeat protein